MIELADKYSCTGCGACADACNNQAIRFVANDEGFNYPVIDNMNCVECGMCRRVCPILSSIRRNDAFSPRLYAAYAKDSSIRKESTSGGVYSILAHETYAEQGYVGGAVYDTDFSVLQIVDNRDQLRDLRRSKYTQSNAVGIYKEIKTLLHNNEQVLFCGTPCQVAALHHYLGKEYTNLTSVDFLCRGVASPLLLRRYISELETKFAAKISSIQMKDKTYGWHLFSMRVEFEDGQVYCKDRHHDAFFRGYLQTDMFLRQSCYQCPFKNIPHASDLTFGDFWKIELLDQSFSQDEGISLVLINSRKGQSAFDKIRESLVWKEFDVDDLLKANPMILASHPTTDVQVRKRFYKDVINRPFSKVIDEYTSTDTRYMKTIKSKLIHILPTWLLRCLCLSYWRINAAQFCEYYDYDIRFNASWRGKSMLSKDELHDQRMRIIRCYRKYQASIGTIWFSYWHKQLQKINDTTGVGLVDNLSIGKGLIIGHIGRIVLNPNADLSKGHLFLTHGVTIGRDIRGKRKGVPTFGKDVVIRCNSTVTGNISIGDDVLIAPNTFVNFDVPSHSVVIGNPASVHHRDAATEGHIGKIV